MRLVCLREDMLYLDVHVQLPARSLEFSALRTSMELYSHHLRNLSAVHFGHVGLNTKNVLITADVCATPCFWMRFWS